MDLVSGQARQKIAHLEVASAGISSKARGPKAKSIDRRLGSGWPRPLDSPVPG